MTLLSPEFEDKWRGKAKAVPEAKRGRDLKGLLYHFEILDHLDSILQQHQGPVSDLPEEHQTKLLVSLLNAYLVAYKELHFSAAVIRALPYLLKPHVLRVHTTPEGSRYASLPPDAGLHNLPVTLQSLLKASVAALYYQLRDQSHLVLLVTKTVASAIQEKLSPKATAQLQALLHRHEPQFGITERLWVMASVRGDAALGPMHAKGSHLYGAMLPEAQAAGLDMLRLKPDMPLGHVMVSHVLMQSMDAVSARLYLEKGLQVAEQTNSQCQACLLRFQLAYAILIGADGETFKKGDVQKLVTEGDNMYKQLRKWKHPTFRAVLHGYEQRVHQMLKNWPQYQASPNSMRIPSLRPAVTTEVEEKGNQSAVCGGCGLRFSKLWKCKACPGVGYCSKKCQRAHWKEHKEECKRIQQKREGHSGS